MGMLAAVSEQISKLDEGFLELGQQCADVAAPLAESRPEVVVILRAHFDACQKEAAECRAGLEQIRVVLEDAVSLQTEREDRLMISLGRFLRGERPAGMRSMPAVVQAPAVTQGRAPGGAGRMAGGPRPPRQAPAGAPGTEKTAVMPQPSEPEMLRAMKPSVVRPAPVAPASTPRLEETRPNGREQTLAPALDLEEPPADESTSSS